MEDLLLYWLIRRFGRAGSTNVTLPASVASRFKTRGGETTSARATQDVSASQRRYATAQEEEVASNIFTARRRLHQGQLPASQFQESSHPPQCGLIT
jgi:hypothetical protein